LGLKAIKAEGGITFAQDERTAKHDGMPRSAVASGCVDFVLPPNDIAQELARIGRHPYVGPRPAPPEEVIPVPEDVLTQVLHVVRNTTGVDLTQYKQNTIKRRVLRRMMLHKIESLDQYLARLTGDTGEIRALYDDILINVTQFFRDPETFETIKTETFPKILGAMSNGGPVRIWVPGCSTGEEAYSLAICLLEFLEDRVPQTPIQIFATDISDMALEKARAGVYTENIVADVPRERLKRFFVKAERGYQISKRIRDLCVFARLNMTKDPPFSNLDLISCRNVLIYLGTTLQKRVLSVFHYALKPTGYLVLGSTETIATYADLFTLADKKHKIFAKKLTATRQPVEFSYVPGQGNAGVGGEVNPRAASTWTAADLQREADRVVLSRFGPPGAVVDEDLDVLQFRGQTGIYLEPSPGPASYNILKMARRGLLPYLRSAIQQARSGDISVRHEGLRIEYDGGSREFDLEVIPIKRSGTESRYFLVLFHPARASTPQKGRPKGQPVSRLVESAELKTLRQDLAISKDNLQAIIEELESSNEELRSANEEIQSSNEELQSTNEELETAKEELQSSNEELNTVNEELENRNNQLTQANNDLRNLLSSVSIPIVMVGNDLSIRRFTPQAEKVLSLISSDLGRPIGNIRPNINISNLEQLLAEVIETLHTYEADVQDVNGRWYSLRIRPYRTEENKIEGAVLALVDIDPLKRSLEATKGARDFNQSVIETIRSPLVVLDNDLQVKLINRAFSQMFHLSTAEVENRHLYQIGGGEWDIQKLRSMVEELLPKKGRVDDYEIENDFPRVGLKTLLLNSRRFVPMSGEAEMVLLAIEDVTERKRSENVLLRAQEELEGKVAQRTGELERVTGTLRAEISERTRIQNALEQSEAVLLQSQAQLRSLAANLITAHEEERRRISRELHDAMNQKLAMLEIDAESLEKKLPAGAEQVRKGLRTLRARVGEVSNETRRLAYQLHPSMLDDLGLEVALRSHIAALSKREGTQIDFVADTLPEKLSRDVSLSLYRIAQEAIHNVIKHARTTQATVSLHVGKQGIQLTILDHGAGFDPQAVRSKRGLGLVSIEERVRLINGYLSIQSKPGQGTKIEVTVPLPAELRKANESPAPADC